MAKNKSQASAKSTVPEKTKVFRDPIHDLIYLGPEDQWALALIDTKEFQRLRRIRQLGVAHLVYPGAEHTRFTHSLGVFNFARRMIARLLERHRKDPEIHDELETHATTIKAAALLHDLGHGPFSHVFERVFKVEGADLQKHDVWTCQILRDSGTEVGEVLLNTGHVDIEDVCKLISDDELRPREPYPFLKAIVSSQLDADRMDYLLRDSVMTGSRYGHFDSEWVLNALVVGELHVGGSEKMLALDAARGTGAIKGLLFARQLMHEYVYGHRATRAYEATLIQAMRLAMRLCNELPDETPRPVRDVLQQKGNVDTNTYLMLDDEVLWWALRQWAVWDDGKTANKNYSGTLRCHARCLVRRERPWAAIELSGLAAFGARKLIKKLEEEDNVLQYCCYLDNLEDLPYKDYAALSKDADEEQGGLGEILLMNAEGRLITLSDYETGGVLQGLQVPKKSQRFFYDRRFSKEFSGLVSEFGVC